MRQNSNLLSIFRKKTKVLSKKLVVTKIKNMAKNVYTLLGTFTSGFSNIKKNL